MKYLLLILLTLTLSCSVEPDLQECNILHLGSLTIYNNTGFDIAYDFDNPPEMEEYGKMINGDVKTIDNLHSGRIKIGYLNKGLDTVINHWVVIKDCDNTLLKLN